MEAHLTDKHRVDGVGEVGLHCPNDRVSGHCVDHGRRDRISAADRRRLQLEGLCALQEMRRDPQGSRLQGAEGREAPHAEAIDETTARTRRYHQNVRLDSVDLNHTNRFGQCGSRRLIIVMWQTAL